MPDQGDDDVQFIVPPLPPARRREVVPPGEPKAWLNWRSVEMEDDPDEASKQAALSNVIGRLQSLQFTSTGHYSRAAHVKTLGVVRGIIKVADTLPAHLRHGLFTQPGRTYAVAGRYANASSHIQDDKVKDSRGLGLKLYGVEGEAIGGGKATTQDLLFNSLPVSELANLDTAFEIFSLQETYWNDPEALQLALRARPDAAKLLAVMQQPNVHIASVAMYSQTPCRFGPYVCKLSLFPTARPQQALRAGRGLPDTADFMAHRKLLRTYFHTFPATYILRAQFCSDLKQHPVEDASIDWDDNTAPWVPLAELVFPIQESCSDARRVWCEDKLALSPWNGLEAHRPLGSLGRARKAAYELSRRKRSIGNVVPVVLGGKIEDMPP